MLPKELEERITREPFQPFRIRTSSGEAYDVTAPLSVAMMKSKAFVVERKTDRWAEISYLHITAFESIAAGSTTKPGKRK